MHRFFPDNRGDRVDKTVRTLQKRGIFRREHEGRTLRDHAGLPRSANRPFAQEG